MSDQKALLLDEQPLFLLPSLAMIAGVEGAVFLQQLHYLLQISKNEKDGKKWVYNSLEEWTEQFPFWKTKPLRNLIKRLEDENLITIGNYSSGNYNRTNWYTINYSSLNQACSALFVTNVQKGQNGMPKRAEPLHNITIHNIISEKPLEAYNANSEESSNVGHYRTQISHSNKKADSKILTEETAVPLDYSKVWEIAVKKGVSVQSVQKVQQEVFDSIADGNKYKTKSISRTVQKWIDLGIGRGSIQRLDEIGMMILESDSPINTEERKRVFDQLRKGIV